MIKKVSEGIYRGSRPSDDDLILLKTFGIKTILDLENDAEAIGHESHVTRKLCIDFEYVEMSEIKRPTDKQLAQALQLIKIAKKPMYIHCLHGHERTGRVIAEYRSKIEDWKTIDAIKEALKEGFSPLYLWWFL